MNNLMETPDETIERQRDAAIAERNIAIAIRMLADERNRAIAIRMLADERNIAIRMLADE